MSGELRLPSDLTLNADAYLVFDYRPTVELSGNAGQMNEYWYWDEREAAPQAVIDLRLRRSCCEGAVEAFVGVENILGFFRGRVSARTFPIQEAQPIGGRVLIGLRVLGPSATAADGKESVRR